MTLDEARAILIAVAMGANYNQIKHSTWCRARELIGSVVVDLGYSLALRKDIAAYILEKLATHEGKQNGIP